MKTKTHLLIVWCCCMAAGLMGCSSSGRIAVHAPDDSIPARRVAVMVFDGGGEGPKENMGSQLAYEFATRLSLGEVEVAGPRELEGLFSDAGENAPHGTSREDLRAIQRVTGCDILVLGQILSFEAGDQWDSPEVSMMIRVYDLDKGIVVHRDGRLLSGRTDPGHLRDVVALALDCADVLADGVGRRLTLKNLERTALR